MVRAYSYEPSVGYLKNKLIISPTHFHPQDVFRWARIMCELFKETWARSPAVAQRAQAELAIKLQSLMVLDSGGRAALPQEGKYAQTAIYCLALAAGPATLPDSPPDSGLSKRDFVRLLITSIRAGLEFHQSVSAMALGNVHSSCQSLVVQECMVLTEDYLPDRQMQRVRMETINSKELQKLT